MIDRAKDQERAPLEEAAARLTRLRDELRLQAHLGGMEIREQWEEAQPQLQALADELGTSLRRGAGEARVQLELGLMELRDRWAKIEPRLLDLVDQVRGADGQRLRGLLGAAGEAMGGGTPPDRE